MKKRGILLIGAVCLTSLLACGQKEEHKVEEVPPAPAEEHAAPAMSEPEATTGEHAEAPAEGEHAPAHPGE